MLSLLIYKPNIRCSFFYPLFRLDVVHRIHRGYSPTLNDYSLQYNGADDDECQGKQPPVDMSMLGKVLQPLLADVVTDRGCYHEGDNQRNCVTPGAE